MAVPVKRPEDWEAVIACAWARVIGMSPAKSAEVGDVSTTSLRNWMASDWWQEALEEARSMLPKKLGAMAIAALQTGLENADQTTARYIADRLIPELAPPTLRTDVTSDGKKLESIPVMFVSPDDYYDDEE